MGCFMGRCRAYLKKLLFINRLIQKTGGGGGIRTREGREPPHAFQACALSHSATPPGAGAQYKPAPGNWKRRQRLALGQGDGLQVVRGSR